MKLKGRRYNDIKKNVSEVLNTLTANDFKHGIERLKARVNKFTADTKCICKRIGQQVFLQQIVLFYELISLVSL